MNNIPPVQETPSVNDTGITNETQDNQTGPLLAEENNSPEAFDQSVSVDKDGQVEITLGATDEDNDPLKFDVTADPLQGTLDNFDGESGTATYVPKQGYSGSDHFRFRAIDDKGFESNVAQVDITVNEVSQSNETQADGLTESTEDTTNETSTERDTGTSALEQPNQPPNANAGNDQNVEVNTQVNLDGSKSSDQDGEIVSYKWEQTGGAEIELKQADAQTASFDVPESAADSTLTFKLTVVDDKDASDPDEVTVEIGSAVNNEAQQTDSNTNEQNETGTNTDTNTKEQTDTSTNTNQQTDTNTNTNQQTDTNTNTNQQTDTNTNTDTNQQTDTNTNTNDTNTNTNTNQQTDTDTNQQTDTNTNTDTNDTNQQTDTDTNQQTDTNTNTNQQTDTNTNTNEQTETQQVEQNISPKADAGGDKNAEVNTEVKLDGGDSADEDGEIVSYKWEQTDGPKVDLKNDDEKTASFDVPESAADSKLSFRLTVADNKDASDSDDTTVEVKSVENQPPKADAGGDKNAEVKTEVKLDGGDSADEDGEIVSYKWEQTDGPKVDLKNGDEKTANFDVPESAADSKLSFKLKVVDDKDASDSDNTTVEVKSVPQESDEESDTQDNSDAKGNSDTKGKSN